MRLRALSFTAALLLTVAPAAMAQAQTSAQTATAAPAGAVAVPAIPFTTRTLPNGLKVYAVRDTTTPNVSIQVWYDVGSKDDPEGRSGFAHLFEHLLFKATRHMPNETIDRLTEDVGGYNNAFTDDDVTAYYEVVPANHLERLLWAEAERMSNLVIEPTVFASERDVVKEEYRQNYLANPYGRLQIALTENSFQKHPYRRPGIGDIPQLDAATVEDVRAFHATYYRPDNAHLIVVGNFDPAQLDRWVDQYFGKIERPAAPIPRVTTKEPERTGARTVTVYGPNVPLPAVAVSYPGLPANSPDASAVDVLDAILSKGESSRLYRALVYEQQVAASAGVFNTQNVQAGYFAPMAIAAGGKSLADAEKALLAEVARVRDGGVTAAELEEAKTELLAEALRERETAEGRAQALGWAIIRTGDPRDADRDLAELQAVTAADVQRVARQLLRDDRRVVIRYLDDAQRPAGAPAEPARPAPPKTVDLTRATKVTVVQPAPEAQRQRPPEPGAPRPLTAPKTAERTLANGLRVVVAPAGQLPLAAARLQVRAGAAEDPKTAPGVAAMTANLLTQGTSTRSAEQVARAVEALGADLSAAAGWDGTAVALNVLNTRLDPAMAVMADVVRNPAFAAEELERQRAQALDGLEVSMSQPGGLAGLLAPRVVFGDGPYGHPQGGTPESLKGMTVDQLRAFHAARFAPANATLVLTGAITPDEGFALAEKHFGAWRGSAAAPASATAPPPPAPTVVIVDIPGQDQAAVVAARPALRRTDPQFIPAQVAASVLGGGYSARLNQEIRIKRGLSYGAFASLSARESGGVLTASTQTKTASAPEVADLIQAELRELATDPLPAPELTARKSTLIGSFGRNIETVNGLASEIGNLTVYGLPLTELERYPSAVQAVTAEQVKAIAAQQLSPEGASLIVVGDAKGFADQLKAKHPNAVVVPAAEIDLDGPSLRKSGR